MKLNLSRKPSLQPDDLNTYPWGRFAVSPVPLKLSLPNTVITYRHCTHIEFEFDFCKFFDDNNPTNFANTSSRQTENDLFADCSIGEVPVSHKRMDALAEFTSAMAKPS
ncbi:hypothetical protein JTB14_020946 [Gonioctena quinquepunctata]|nr:hypothetical protein JTB14_020946 [Gonioctena quinquepunctata]